MTKTAPNARATAIDWAHVDDLRPNPRNPRRHGQEVMRLARSILRTAWGAPIVAQRATKRIIGGHGRLEAAKEIMAGIEVDGELRGGHEHLFDKLAPGPGMVPVRWVDVSDAEADAMTLADNARALQGVDDPLAIVEMAQQFGRESETMRDLGFDAETLDAIVKSAGDAVLSDDTKEASTNEIGEMRFRVIVDVSDEHQQASLIERLETEGFSCQPLMS